MENSSDINIDDETRKLYKSLCFQEIGYMILKVENKGKDLVLESHGPSKSDFETTLKDLPDNECRFVFFDFRFLSNKRSIEKTILIKWVPSGASPFKKIPFSHATKNVLKQFKGVQFEFLIDSKAELTNDFIIQKISKTISF